MKHVKTIADWCIKKKLVLMVILLIAFAARFFHIGQIPDGIHPDEAYAAYNAYSMLKYGIDSWGYHNPVYFVAWGGGMNVLNSYLMMPFIAILGVNTISIRLASTILSCLSVAVMYLLLKKIFEERTALLGTFLLAVCPWQIVIGRNNIESSLLSYFMIFSTYFFVKALDNPKWLYVSAVSYGLTLYTYAVIWPVLPFIILFQVAYAVRYKKIKLKSKELIISTLILFTIACPLMLFMLINNTGMHEIVTPFISIPKLPGFRSNDISLTLLPDNIVHFFNMLSMQKVSGDYNSFAEYGLFYKYSNLLILIGGCIFMADVFKKLKKREYSGQTYLAIWLVGTFSLGLMIPRVNPIRVNSLFPMLTLVLALGIIFIGKHYWKPFIYIMTAVYCLSFMSFFKSYVRNYNGNVSEYFLPEAGAAIEYACDISSDNDRIYVDDTISYALVLYYTKMPAHEFIETVEYKDYPNAYMDVGQYGKFETYDKSGVYDGTYILNNDDCKELSTDTYSIERFGNYSVVTRK